MIHMWDAHFNQPVTVSAQTLQLQRLNHYICTWFRLSSSCTKPGSLTPKGSWGLEAKTNESFGKNTPKEWDIERVKKQVSKFLRGQK